MGSRFEFGMGFGAFGVMFTAVFIIVIGMFVVILAKNISTWHKNNNSPRLTVTATVAAKRINISRHRRDHHVHTSTTYYVTFEVESSGDRMELRVDGSEYGLVCEGDRGELTFQGTRFLDFVRI